jgi:RES domain-containing protein
VTRPLVGAVFRADHPAHTELERTAAKSRDTPGRFNTSRLAAVYLSREPETAIKELTRNHDDETRHGLFVLGISVARAVDFTQPADRQVWELTLDDLQGEDVSRCQRVAEDIARSGADAVLWPSATGEGQSLAVFLERLSPPGLLEIARVIELSDAAVASIQAGIKPDALFPSLADLPRI